MDRDIPTFNRPIIDRIQAKNLYLHQQRLMNIKNSSSFNKQLISTNYKNAPPLRNKKGYLIQQQKKTQIQKQNVLLFNKMMHIMKRPDSNNGVMRPTHTSHLNSNANKLRGSVDISRISQENKHLFERLEKQKPTISNKKFYEQRKKNLNILKFLGKYPNPNVNQQQFLRSSQANQKGDLNFKRKMNTTYQSNITNTSSANMNFARESSSNYQRFRSQIDKFDLQMKQIQQSKHFYQQGFNQSQQRRKFLSQGMNRNQYQKMFEKKEDDIHQHQPLEHEYLRQRQNQPNIIPSRAIKTSYLVKQKRTLPQIQSRQQQLKSIILFKTKSHLINGQQSQIKIYRHYDQYEIHAKMAKTGIQYSLTIPQIQGNQFLSDFDYDYKRIVDMLIIQDQKLVIDIPNQQQEDHNLQINQALNHIERFSNDNINKKGIIVKNSQIHYNDQNKRILQKNIIIQDDRTPQFTFKPKININSNQANSLFQNEEEKNVLNENDNDNEKEQNQHELIQNRQNGEQKQMTYQRQNQNQSHHQQAQNFQQNQNVQNQHNQHRAFHNQIQNEQKINLMDIKLNQKTCQKQPKILQKQWGRYQQALDQQLQ